MVESMEDQETKLDKHCQNWYGQYQSCSAVGKGLELVTFLRPLHREIPLPRRD